MLNVAIMTFAGLCFCGYLLEIITAQSSTNTTLNVLENSPAMFTYTNNEMVASTNVTRIFHFRNGYIYIIFNGLSNSCEATGNVYNSTNYDFMCNRTHASLTAKQIDRTEHYTNCTISVRGGGNGSPVIVYILYVIVPINNIVIINSSDGQVEFPENTAINISCKSSPSRPNATIEWRIDHHNTSIPLISTAIYWSELMNGHDGLFPSESVVSLNLNKTFNGHTLSCTGNNTLNNPISNSTRLNVTYPPSSNKLKIEGLENGTNYLIEEYTVKTLVCSIDESNPKAELSWSCTHALFERNTTDSISWTALRGKNTQCICQSFYMLLRYAFVFVNVDVLYKPENIVAHLCMDSVNVTNVSLTFNVTENNSSNLVLTCIATANPPPTIYWEGQQTNWSNILRLNVTRGFSGQYKCQAINSMNFTDQNPKTGKSEQSYNIDILYPPDVQELKNQVVVEKDSVNIRCSLYEGKTTIQTVTWWKSMTMVSNNSVLEIRNLNRTHLGSYACFLNFTMVPTYGVAQTDFRNKSFLLDVLYPPENVTANLDMGTVHNDTIFNTLTVIENTSLILVLNCSASGNPQQISYSWIGPQNSSSATLKINVSRKFNGNYICQTKNSKLLTNGTYFNGFKEKSYYIGILYPPEIKPLENTTVIEGHNYSVNCLEMDGHTNSTSVKWLKNNGTEEISKSLNIQNVNKNHAGKYVCYLTYIMLPTYGEPKTGSSNKSFFLEVLYKASISSFFINEPVQSTSMTVNESASVRMMCILDSNPNSTMRITLKNTTKSSKEMTKTLEYFISRSNCTDTGIYVCSGYNYLNEKGYISSKEVRFYVNCSPRPSPNAQVKTNITKSEQGSATFTFVALAYPPPSFKWFRFDNSILKEANNGFSKTFNISENELRIEFAISNVTELDYGEYMLTMNNTFGSQQQSYFLFQTGLVTKTENSSIVGPAAGGAVGGVLAMAVIALALFVIRRRRMQKMPQEDKKSHEYQNMNFLEDAKQHKRLPPLPVEDTYDIHDQKEHNTHQVEEIRPEIKTREIEMHQKPKEIKQHPEYQNMNLMEDIRQHKQIHPVAIENGRKEHQIHKGDVPKNHLDPKTQEIKMPQKPKQDKQHSDYENMNLAGDAKHHKRPPPIPTDDDVPEQQHRVNHTDDSEDCTYPQSIEIINKISLSDLLSYVTSNTTEDYRQEYARFPGGMIESIPFSFARKTQNVPLNRYQGIYPYDHSRVVIPAEPDFFINANYIDGHSKQKAYIASLGPTVRHTLSFQTFWKMVWHEKSDVIVMLTNLQEPSGMKCEKYWADKGTTREVGDFTIQSVNEDVAAEYIVRTFNVSKKGESRLVTQLHYTAWPDKKVPEDVTSLIEFWQRVNAVPTRSLGPLVVHCSAGIGRTGTYIALDRLFEEGKTTNSVNVFDCVMSMRQQRVNMVQTQDQYIYLHQALVYCLVFDTEPVTADKIEEYVLTTSHNVYIKLFEQLKQSVEVESTYEAEARTRNCDYDERNRTQADIPGDAHRIRLFLDKESDESDYINAVYLNSFKRLGYFIIAQSPLPNTLDDFVLMLYQENCCCIVSLDDYQQKGTNNAVYLPAENQHATYGTCTISSTMVDSKSAYSVRKLKIGHSSRYEKGMKIAHHFEYTGWKHDERIPKDVNMFVEFVQEVEEYATQLADEHSHVLVHCLTGSGRSGLFCAVSNLIQKMGQERQVSVVNTLRQVRARRQTAIRNTEQLKFCYQSVYAFVKNYKV